MSYAAYMRRAQLESNGFVGSCMVVVTDSEDPEYHEIIGSAMTRERSQLIADAYNVAAEEVEAAVREADKERS